MVKPLAYYVGGLSGTQEADRLAEIEERYDSQLQALINQMVCEVQ
jgi:hypothetical protein